MVIEFEVPVYFTQTFKKKSDKIHFVGMNFYRNAHFTIQNSVKKHYNNLVQELIGHLAPEEPMLSYKVSYKYYYKNRSTDLSNVCSLISKFVNDSFQELGFVVDDNVQHLREETFSVGGLDTTNPRVVVRLENYTKR
jgi:hypothetical protein